MFKSYLALGDSYSIGEQVLLTESFPYQTVQFLRKAGVSFFAPEIIAKTGWTTEELWAHIETLEFLPEYDCISLLIGVNDQYRGLQKDNFMESFKTLLHFALQKSGNKAERVFILSVPDWGVTSFAEGRDREKIRDEIDFINTHCEMMATKMGCHYIDITHSQRADVHKEGFVACDNLHPSGKEYRKWAKLLAESILKQI